MNDIATRLQRATKTYAHRCYFKEDSVTRNIETNCWEIKASNLYDTISREIRVSDLPDIIYGARRTYGVFGDILTLKSEDYDAYSEYYKKHPASPEINELIVVE